MGGRPVHIAVARFTHRSYFLALEVFKWTLANALPSVRSSPADSRKATLPTSNQRLNHRGLELADVMAISGGSAELFQTSFNGNHNFSSSARGRASNMRLGAAPRNRTRLRIHDRRYDSTASDPQSLALCRDVRSRQTLFHRCGIARRERIIVHVVITESMRTSRYPRLLDSSLVLSASWALVSPRTHIVRHFHAVRRSSAGGQHIEQNAF